MRIGILCDNTLPYSAGVKPLIDISDALEEAGQETICISLDVKNNLYQVLKRRSNLWDSIPSMGKTKNLQIVLKDYDLDFIITDDYIPRIITGMFLKESFKNSKLIIYATLTFGLNFINSRNKSIGPIKRSISFIPWRIITRNYVKYLKKADFVVPCSHSLGYLISNVYGINCSPAIYPPVNTSSSVNIGDKIRSGLFVYLGHYPDYFIRDVQSELYTYSSTSGINLDILISPQSKINFKLPNATYHTNISSNELQSIYARSDLTYVATAWEGFGYIGPESLTFGTPVILDTFQPWMERFPTETNMVRLLNPRLSLAIQASRFLDEIKYPTKALEFIRGNFSNKSAANKFLRLFEETNYEIF